MDQLRTTLVKNEWIIGLLIESVRQKIGDVTKQLVSKSTSTTYLTTSYYKPGGINSEVNTLKCNTLQFISAQSQQAPYFAKQVDHIFKAETLLKSSDLIKTAASWMEEFVKFCEINPSYNTLNHFLEYAILLENVSFRGASHPHFLSSLFLQLRPDDTKFDFLVSIIHEAAHQELFLVNFVDRLVNEKFDHNLIHAPYQNKIRPPIGRIHSLHALYRMNQFIMTFEPDHPKFNFFKSKFNSNLTSFEVGELTEFGNFLIRDVYEPFSKKNI
jgi:hypothetical protein